MDTRDGRATLISQGTPDQVAYHERSFERKVEYMKQIKVSVEMRSSGNMHDCIPRVSTDQRNAGEFRGVVEMGRGPWIAAEVHPR